MTRRWGWSLCSHISWSLCSHISWSLCSHVSHTASTAAILCQHCKIPYALRGVSTVLYIGVPACSPFMTTRAFRSSPCSTEILSACTHIYAYIRVYISIYIYNLWDICIHTVYIAYIDTRSARLLVASCRHNI